MWMYYKAARMAGMPPSTSQTPPRTIDARRSA
jgi:hypothetical protein